MIDAETLNQSYFQVRAVDQEALGEYPPVFLQEQLPPEAIVSVVQRVTGGVGAGGRVPRPASVVEIEQLCLAT